MATLAKDFRTGREAEFDAHAMEWFLQWAVAAFGEDVEQAKQDVERAFEHDPTLRGWANLGDVRNLGRRLREHEEETERRAMEGRAA